jgi:hypothetical protein
MTINNQPDEFTGQWVRELLKEKRVIRGAHRLPSLEDCERLGSRVRDLHFSRRTVQQGEFWFRLLRLGLKMLDDARLSAREEVAAELSALRAQWSESDWRWLLEKFEQAAGARPSQAEALFWLDFYYFHAAREWNDFGPELAGMFRQAVENANPGLQIGLADDGPIARFIALVVPYITGETPTVTAVARELQRRAARRARISTPAGLQ